MNRAEVLPVSGGAYPYAWLFRIAGVVLYDSFLRAGYAKTSTNPNGYHFATDIGRYRRSDGALVSMAGQVVATPVSGVVVRCQYQSYWGNYVRVKGDDGAMWLFAHLARLPGFTVGQRITRGYRFGYVGCSGNCSGAHLHVEVWKGWDDTRDPRINPYPVLKSIPQTSS